MYKILVADDENLIRKSIVTKLKKSPYSFSEILEARNANEALQIDNPDILITDIKMGNPNGLELARKMQETNPGLKTIIISGYSEFDFAREALAIGVIDYLVKPINTENLLSSLKKGIQQIKQEKDDKTIQSKALMEESSSRLSALLQNSRFLTNEDLSPYFNLRHYGCFWSVRLFIPVPNENIFHSVMDTIQVSPFQVGKDIAVYKDRLRQIGLLFAFSEKQENRNGRQRKILSLINAISKDLAEKGMDNFTFGISASGTDPLLCHEQSLKAMHHRIVFPDREIIEFQDCDNIEKEFNLTKEEKTQFLLLISTQSVHALVNFMDRLNESLENTLPVSYHSLQILFNFIMDTLISTLKFSPTLYSSTRNPYHFNSIREMTDYLKSICLRAIEQAEEETNDSRTFHLVTKLQNIIKEHCDQPFTLELFCTQNNINTSFFSSQFHLIAGVTFQEFLNNTRIENAKKLLRETENKVGVIAKLCGYSDQQYFSKTFKRLTGLTPREYRNEM
ncbi:MAG: response regulator [Spirochaetales bacterium]|nr:response regulator [Spirochaetales bacterium]